MTDEEDRQPVPLRRPDFGPAVAELELLFVWPDGTERIVKARVGHPYLDGAETWACPCEIAGFERRYPDLRGVDSWQSLCLAICLVRSRLEDWLSKGGAILSVDTREPIELASLFGSMAL